MIQDQLSILSIEEVDVLHDDLTAALRQLDRAGPIGDGRLLVEHLIDAARGCRGTLPQHDQHPQQLERSLQHHDVCAEGDDGANAKVAVQHQVAAHQQHQRESYLRQILDMFDTPDIKKAFDANTKWDVIELVSQKHLGGMADLSQRAKLAESGRRILQYVADNDFRTTIDPIVFQADAKAVGMHAEAWIAAYRTTPEGRKFPGVTENLRWSIGLSTRQAERIEA